MAAYFLRAGTAIIDENGKSVGKFADVTAVEVEFLEARGGGDTVEGGKWRLLVMDTGSFHSKGEFPQTTEGNGTATTEAEVEEAFDSWLDFHSETTGMRKLRSGTQIRLRVKKSYAARLCEGYTDEDLRMAVVGAFNDEWRREHGYYDPESVLRPTKVHRLVEVGRSRPVSKRPVTMADREASMRSLQNGSAQRAITSEIVGLVRTLLFPPEPGSTDPFTGEPDMQADEARAKLAGLVPDVDAAIAEHRQAVLETTLRYRKSA